MFSPDPPTFSVPASTSQLLRLPPPKDLMAMNGILRFLLCLLISLLFLRLGFTQPTEILVLNPPKIINFQFLSSLEVILRSLIQIFKPVGSEQFWSTSKRSMTKRGMPSLHISFSFHPSNLSAFPAHYRVGQNLGKKVLRMSSTKFHLLIIQFVVIPHG